VPCCHTGSPYAARYAAVAHEDHVNDNDNDFLALFHVYVHVHVY